MFPDVSEISAEILAEIWRLAEIAAEIWGLAAGDWLGALIIGVASLLPNSGLFRNKKFWFHFF